MKKAIGFIEFKSIPIGIEATDQMLKSGNVDLISATPLCPGKYVTLISGDVGAVRSSIKNGEHVGGIYVLESHVIPNIHKDVLPALLGAGEVEEVKSLGIIETINAISSIVVADAAVKSSNVDLIEIRIARGLGGKGYVLLTGEVSSVKTAVKAAQVEMEEYGVITSYSVIPSPHKDIKQVIF
ncbi:MULTISPECIES: BMC domain-containing protein [Eubacterium]|uniref:Carboxysome shell and ethanolamine utilization microcompartment protein CcmL/EutN n=1 Tax=Eubacterium barkeri TaxID=1528 RepID=A0A1H3AZQ2_EUBBA|nr:BMC domain-containing protein [Eubacterium barkeri]SDX34908.1 Carboxysome shell and ethanolamine utilization microcompartment protein CcmL/EutN [Eubacterium barkeri]